MTQGLRMIVEPDYHRNIDPCGDWDGTWDESYAYVIYDAYGYEEARWVCACWEQGGIKGFFQRLFRRS